MNCKDIKDIIHDYLENELNPEVNPIVKSHIASCPECKEEVAFFNLYQNTVRLMPQIKAPADFLDQLQQRMTKKPLSHRIFDGLMLPLKYKLPVHAFGLIIVTVFIFVLYNPLKQLQKPAGHNSISMEKSVGQSEDSVFNKGKDMPKDIPASPSNTAGKKPQSSIVFKKNNILDSSSNDKKLFARKKLIVDDVAPIGDMKSNTGKMRYSKEERADEKKNDSDSKLSGSGINQEKTKRGEKPSETIYNISIIIKDEEKAAGFQNKSDDLSLPSKNAKSSINKDSSRMLSEQLNPLKQTTTPITQIRQSVIDVQGIILRDHTKGQQQSESKNIIVEIPAKNYAIFLEKLRKVGSLKNVPVKMRSKKPLKSEAKMKLNVELSH